MKQECDFCGKEAMYDGKTRLGPWASMCGVCFLLIGIGLGLGKGQKIKKKEVVKK